MRGERRSQRFASPHWVFDRLPDHRRSKQITARPAGRDLLGTTMADGRRFGRRHVASSGQTVLVALTALRKIAERRRR
jgi:hypothetical protein